MSSRQTMFHRFATARGPTVKELQTILQSIGAATSGTKDQLQSRMFQETLRSRSAASLQEKKTSRILSIDMGIKNLAYCVADVEHSMPQAGAAKMHVLSWQRIDLTARASKDTLDEKKKDGTAEQAGVNAKEDEDLFTPESLSRIAYRLLRFDLLQYRPDIILIERQRWRSSSSSAIQQWTVRVNTLEAMLWAVLTTLRGEHRYSTHGRSQDGTVGGLSTKGRWTFAVDPKRVGTFWLDSASRTASPAPSRRRRKEKDDEKESTAVEESAPKTLSRGKAEKKAKIQLLRSWLDSPKPSTSPLASKATNDTDDDFLHLPHPTLSFTFADQPPSTPASTTITTTTPTAQSTRQSLLDSTSKPVASRTKRSKSTQSAPSTPSTRADTNKVDDLTDCFLQAAAWVAWEENATELQAQREAFCAEVEEKLGRRLVGVGALEDAVGELWGGRGMKGAEGGTKGKGKRVRRKTV